MCLFPEPLHIKVWKPMETFSIHHYVYCNFFIGTNSLNQLWIYARIKEVHFECFPTDLMKMAERDL